MLRAYRWAIWSAGSSSLQMEHLVNKWFLGLDRPTAGGAYRLTAGQLFVGGAAYTDINQGYLGDCYFVSTLAETALKNPGVIANMFITNGDGTYTVRFYNNGKPQYVTVDSYLPTDASGRLIYAGIGSMYNNAGNELWVCARRKGICPAERDWLCSPRPVGQRPKRVLRHRRRIHLCRPKPNHRPGDHAVHIDRLHEQLPGLCHRVQPRQGNRLCVEDDSCFQLRSSEAMPTPSWATTPQTKP